MCCNDELTAFLFFFLYTDFNPDQSICNTRNFLLETINVIPGWEKVFNKVTFWEILTSDGPMLGELSLKLLLWYIFCLWYVKLIIIWAQNKQAKITIMGNHQIVSKAIPYQSVVLVSRKRQNQFFLFFTWHL